MSIITADRFKFLLKASIRRKTVMWLLFSLVLSIVLLRDSWTEILVVLSPDWIFGEYHVAPWGILVLCFVFIWLKRRELWEEMSQGNIFHNRWDNYTESGTIIGMILISLILIAGATLLPISRNYLVFKILLASVGIFVIFFFKAVKIPVILLVIYGMVITFPLMIQHFFEYSYSQTAIVPLMKIMNILGYQIQNQGSIINISTVEGVPIFTTITTACAGPTTMAVFIALFTLMMLDRPLFAKKAIGLFVFGVVGTWIQSTIRLILLMIIGYYWGEDALWTAHYWTIYILFPLWYLLFVFIYFRQFQGSPESTRKQRVSQYTATDN
ncbi:exosortase/archaeosortase family protein [Chloroflexota bacterium]